jgi:membrane-associated phospholipid phosphatase
LTSRIAFSRKPEKNLADTIFLRVPIRLFLRRGLRRVVLIFSLVFLPFCFSFQLFSQQDPNSVDVRLFRTINNSRSPFLDGFFNVNNDLLFPIGLSSPVGFLAYGIASGNEYELDTGILATASEVISFATGETLKRIINRSRPYATLPHVHTEGDVDERRSSFPSGHATTAFALATSLSLRYPKPTVYVPLHMWAFLVAYGRVYRGMHYPSDVLVGGIIGSGTALVIHLFEDDILRLKAKLVGGSDSAKQASRRMGISIAPIKDGAVVKISFGM